jgi:hypothetical protein
LLLLLLLCHLLLLLFWFGRLLFGHDRTDPAGGVVAFAIECVAGCGETEARVALDVDVGAEGV